MYDPKVAQGARPRYSRPAIRDYGDCPPDMQASVSPAKLRRPSFPLLWTAVAFTAVAVLVTEADDWFVDVLFAVIFVVAAAPVANRIARREHASDLLPTRSRAASHLRLISASTGGDRHGSGGRDRPVSD